jgi:hypothetical protein
VSARPFISPEQRRARLAVRQLLGPARRVSRPEQVADALVALHATDPATVHLSLVARLAEPDRDAIDRALYEGWSLVRLHGMRHTLFVVPEELAPVVYASTTRAVAEKERRGLLAFAAEGGFDAAWLAEVERQTLSALDQLGQATGAQLGKTVPGLREGIRVAVGKPYEATQTIGTRLLRVLGMEGSIVRRRPVGSWLSGQYQWSHHPELPDLPVDQARATLVARWLAAYGPGTAQDLKWWTGWTLGQVRKALTACAAVPVELAEGEGFVLPEDTGPVAEPEPWAALLPALDPTPMGWQQRDFYLPPDHRAELFDRSGNIGPTVWWQGQVVGGWAQRPDGELAWELLADVGSEAQEAIAAEAERLAAWLGSARVTPRFRTPLERRLSA